MVDSPIDQGRKTDGSVCTEVKEQQFEGPLPSSVVSVGICPVMSCEKDAKTLKSHPSLAVNAKVLWSTREFKSTVTKGTPSYLSPTISSSRRTNSEKQNDEPSQALQIKPRLKRSSESPTIKTSQLQDTPARRMAPFPLSVADRSKKTAAPPQVSQEKTQIQTSTNQSQPRATHTKNSKVSVSPQALPGKTRTLTSINRTISSASTKEPSRIRKTSLRHEEPIFYIEWEDPDETFHPSGITCPLCENDLSYMPEEYEDEYYDDVEPSVFPGVAILPCGHCLHCVCLDSITPEEQSADPPCFFCLSLES